MEPTASRFRRLARSAPFRWHVLELEGTWGNGPPMRVRVERPDRVRVHDLSGRLLHDERHSSLSSGQVLGSDGRSWPSPPPPALVPELDEDGLVTTVRRPWDEGPEVPFWQDYRFVAVLDPYELSDGVEVLEVRAVEHGGRPAWEALLRPAEGYDPRCACCPLLLCLACDLAEGLPPRPGYAEAHRVRLDVGTGVCVLTEELGGPTAGSGHALVLREVVTADGRV